MKRAIIVGNGGCLLNSENGHAIDDFDIVIRFNDFRISGYEKHVGTKVDIMCHSAFPKLLHMIQKGNDPNCDWWADNGFAYDDYVKTVETVWGCNSKAWMEGRMEHQNWKTGPVTVERIAEESNIKNFEFLKCYPSFTDRSGFFDNPDGSRFLYWDKTKTKDHKSATAGLKAIAHAVRASTGITSYDKPCNSCSCKKDHTLRGYKIFITGFDGLETQHYYSKNGNSQGFTTVGHDSGKEKKWLSMILKSGLVTQL